MTPSLSPPSPPPQPPQPRLVEPPADDDEPRLEPRTDGGSQRKLKLINHLVSSLDMIIFAELCALYYMDCSFFRLFIRATAQWMLNPTPIENLVHMPANSAYLLAIAVSNAICMLFHVFSSLPEPAPASRGYVHGGIIVDFIGQKPPSSSIPLLLIDVFIVILQCILMCIQEERQGIGRLVRPTPLSQPSNPTRSTSPRPELEDRLLEEGGIRSLEDPPPGQDSSQLEDSLRSGTSLLAEINIFGCLRRAYNVAPDERMLSGTYSFQNLRYSRALGAIAAERRRRMQQNAQQPIPPGG